MSIEQNIRTKEGEIQPVDLTPLKAIRYKCKECLNFQVRAIARCDSPLCPLFPYRMGKDPSLKGKRKNNLKRWYRTQKRAVRTPSRMRRFEVTKRRSG